LEFVEFVYYKSFFYRSIVLKIKLATAHNPPKMFGALENSVYSV